MVTIAARNVRKLTGYASITLFFVFFANIVFARFLLASGLGSYVLTTRGEFYLFGIATLCLVVFLIIHNEFQ